MVVVQLRDIDNPPKRSISRWKYTTLKVLELEFDPWKVKKNEIASHPTLTSEMVKII